jgi:hypothetical protein
LPRETKRRWHWPRGTDWPKETGSRFHSLRVKEKPNRFLKAINLRWDLMKRFRMRKDLKRKTRMPKVKGWPRVTMKNSLRPMDSDWHFQRCLD